jgi:hypothetical protein
MIGQSISEGGNWPLLLYLVIMPLPPSQPLIIITNPEELPFERFQSSASNLSLLFFHGFGRIAYVSPLRIVQNSTDAVQ